MEVSDVPLLAVASVLFVTSGNVFATKATDGERLSRIDGNDAQNLIK